MVNTALYNLQQPIRYIEKTFLQKYSKLRKSNINYNFNDFPDLNPGRQNNRNSQIQKT
jgi:hypothetical protein